MLVLIRHMTEFYVSDSINNEPIGKRFTDEDFKWTGLRNKT